MNQAFTAPVCLRKLLFVQGGADAMKQPCVYIMTNENRGTLYVGVTSNLAQRAWQHREGLVDGFTRTHGLNQLVWFEEHDTMDSAFEREKQLKKWRRIWKIRLIESVNQDWRDLANEPL